MIFRFFIRAENGYIVLCLASNGEGSLVRSIHSRLSILGSEVVGNVELGTI